MQSIELPAFITSISYYGESHLLMTIATSEKGLLKGVAVNARKSVRRFIGAIDYFKLISVTISRKKRGEDLWHFEKARVIHYYSGIVSDLEKYITGCWVINTTNIMVPIEMPETPAFQWIMENFEYFEEKKPDPAVIFISFIKLMEITGDKPTFDRCVKCGKLAPESKSAYYEPSSGGIVCRKCGGGEILLSGDLRMFMHEASQSPNIHSISQIPLQLITAANKECETVFKAIEKTEEYISGQKNKAGNVLFKHLTKIYHNT